MTVAEDPYAPALLWKQARNRALETLDMEWARDQMPNMTDHGRLMTMHVARYREQEFDLLLRMDSAEWLRARGHKVLPEGELP